MTKLSARDFTWTPLDRATPTLAGITLDVRPGERVLLAGASGSGKSTLLRALAGVLDEVNPGIGSGALLIDDAPPVAGDGRVGLVSQNPLDARVAETVGRDVAFGPENLGLSRDAIAERVAWALKAVGFPYGPDHRTNALSGGQAQRLALAGVLALQPGVLLLDEPAAMLDALSASEVRRAISDAVRASCATLVVADHDVAGWVSMVERLIVLDGGKVVVDGPLDEALDAHHDTLLALGIWVPGVPAPTLRCEPSPASHTDIITARDLVVSRRASLGLRVEPDAARPMLALDGIDARLSSGELLALRGPSGSGKSTLIGALCGLLPVDSGTITWRGEATQPDRWTSRTLAARIGWVPQFAEATAIGDTVLDSMLATCRALGDNQDAAHDRALALLERVGLGDAATRHPLRLSGGEQRRLAVATALIHSPDVLALDEPTVGLDRHTWASVAGLIANARANGTAIIASTHDPHLAALADREQVLTATPRPQTDAAGQRRAGLLARCGPLSLLAGLLLLLVGGIAVGDLVGLAIGSAVMALALIVLTGGRFPLIRLVPAALAIASVTWSNWLLGDPRSLANAAVAGLRVAFVAVPGIVIASYLDPTRLGDHLGQRLKLPDRPVLALSAALHRLDDMGELWADLRRARRVRGLEPTRSPAARVRHGIGLLVALLVESIRGAGRLSVAMETRGYSTQQRTGMRRSWASDAPWTRSDTTFVLIAAVMAMVPAVVALTL